MKLLLPVLAVALLTFAHPARADTFAMSGGGFLLSDVPAGSLIETFGTSFIYDSLSGSVSDMSFLSQGLLGNSFSFSGVIDNGTATQFQWSNSEGILTGTFQDKDFAFASRVRFPVNSEGTKAILLTCLTAACTNDFFDPDTGTHGFTFRDAETHLFADFLGPSTSAPEPSSLVLVTVGLLGMGFLTRRRLIFRKRSKTAREAGRAL
jgi:hypothetical protein